MRIGIIGGGGAGLATAWLLNDQHDVTLFEKEPRLGGHADTVVVDVDGRQVRIDAGFEFFSAAMFPVFMRLLALLHVPLDDFELTYSFYTTDRRRTTVLPPWRDGRLIWGSLTPPQLADLLQFQFVLTQARQLNERRDPRLTIDEYLNSLPLTRRFKDDFIKPFLLASWCVPMQDFEAFTAYNVLRYSFKHLAGGLKPFIWKEIRGGTQTYVQALANTLDRTALRLGANITGITYADHVYSVRAASGEVHLFDHLVLATNANQAAGLLKEIPQTEELRALLNRVEYFETTIAVHSDERLMPADRQAWSVVNTRYDGRYSSYTIYKPWNTPQRPVFKSWVTYEDHLPRQLHAVNKYWHGKVNAAYFATQQALPAFQGQNNLWLAGLYTHDVDCHESAVVSGINVARQLAPESGRLKQLLNLG